MVGGVVHLELQDHAEEVVDVPGIRVDEDVGDALLLDLTQDGSGKKLAVQ